MIDRLVSHPNFARNVISFVILVVMAVGYFEVPA
jgi:hypothetical protein